MAKKPSLNIRALVSQVALLEAWTNREVATKTCGYVYVARSLEGAGLFYKVGYTQYRNPHHRQDDQGNGACVINSPELLEAVFFEDCEAAEKVILARLAEMNVGGEIFDGDLRKIKNVIRKHQKETSTTKARKTGGASFRKNAQQKGEYVLFTNDTLNCALNNRKMPVFA